MESNGMKRILAILLAAVMLLSAVPGLAADSDEVDCTLLNLMDYSASEWFGDSDNRTMLAVLATTHLMAEDNADMFSTDFNKVLGEGKLPTIYIATAKTDTYQIMILNVMLFMNGRCHVYAYVPTLESARYTCLEATYSPEPYMIAAKGEALDDYKKVDDTEYATTLYKILSAIKDS